MSDTAWQFAAQDYLARLGAAECHAGIARHKKAGRRVSTYRHTPSDYHRALVELLGQNSEESFKACKMLEGYASAIGV